MEDKSSRNGITVAVIGGIAILLGAIITGLFEKSGKEEIIIDFDTDRKVIKEGESIKLDWEIYYADECFLIYDEYEEDIAHSSSNKKITLHKDTKLTILAKNGGSKKRREINIIVKPKINPKLPSRNNDSHRTNSHHDNPLEEDIILDDDDINKNVIKIQKQ